MATSRKKRKPAKPAATRVTGADASGFLAKMTAAVKRLLGRD